MPDRQRGELFDMTSEKCRAADRETIRSQFRQLFERRIEVTFDAGVEDMKFKPEGFGRRQGHTHLGLAKRFGRVDKQRHDARRRQQLFAWECPAFRA